MNLYQRHVTRQKGYILAGVVGFEPTDAGVKVPCLNRLGYTPTIQSGDTAKEITEFISAPYNTKMAPRTGLEPVTF